MDRGLVGRLLTIRTVPANIVALTAIASYGAEVLAIVAGWPVWAIVLATLLPWLPLLSLELVWTYRHFQWLALFYVLVMTQGGHFVEHLVQVIQIHVLGLRSAAARGIFGQLDIEWVHFLWNLWALGAVLALLWRFRRNPWLRVTAVIAGWHEIEHLYILSTYLATGQPGTPGLLSSGGAIGGGLPLQRPDLHFLYNLVMTMPLVMAFLWQLRRVYDEWLARAFPRLSEDVLVEITERCAVGRFAAGDTIFRQGDPSDRFFIVTAGEVEVVERAPDGRERIIRTIGPGRYFGEMGMLSGAPRAASVRAKDPVEVLTLDREAFLQIVSRSAATADDIARVARQRQSEAPG